MSLGGKNKRKRGAAEGRKQVRQRLREIGVWRSEALVWTCACLNEIISNYFSLQSTVKKLFDEDRKQKGGVAEGEMTEFKCLKMLSGLSCI